MRRLHVRGHENVLKRPLIQVSAFNLGMLMRQSLGVGTPRGLQGRICALMLLILSLFKRLKGSGPVQMRTGLELPRLGGHLRIWEKGVHNGKESILVSA